MISITGIFKLIPDSLKQTAVDAIVETVVERGEGLLSDSILGKIKGLRSDAAFRQQLDAGLQRGLQRFVDEYQLQDEDLVAAIVADDALFAQPDVQQTLLTILQQPGRYLAEEHVALNQSFASVLPQRLNRDRVDRAVAFLLKCLARELWHLPELQPIYSLEFQRITAESTREQLAVQKAQLAALENLNVGVRDALLQLTDALGEQKQLTAGQSSPRPETPPPAVYHNLPQPDYGEFVGREQEIKQIFDLLRPYPQSRHHLIVIDGIGGIGKSTLALEVAHRCLHASQQAARAEQPEQDRLVRLRQILINRFSEDELRTLCFDMALDYDMLPGQGKGGKARELVVYLNRRNRVHEIIEHIQRLRPNVRNSDFFPAIEETPTPEQFDSIIWTSAKRTVLTNDGIKARHQNTNTLADIYRTIAFALEREDILRARFEEQVHSVHQVLTRQRTLLIVDNMETIDDDRVLSFLQELPAPTKAIITSRHRMGTAVAIRLPHMPWPDAKTLIQKECRKRSLSLSDSDARRLFDNTNGLPLAMIWSIAQMGFGYSINAVLARISNHRSDIARFCFDGIVERIQGQSAHKLLIAASMFSTDVSRSGLGHAADLTALDRDEGLVVLEKLSLINKKENRFSLLSLTRTFASTLVTKKDGLKKHLRLRWIDYLKGLLDDPENEYIWRLSNFDFISDGENILEAIEWAYIDASANDVFSLTRTAYYYLEIIGDWNRLLAICHRALDLALSIDDPIKIARFANSLGAVYSQRGEFEQSLQLHQLGLEKYQEAHNPRGIALTLQQQSAIFRKQGDFLRARSILDEAMDIALALDDGDLQALIEANYGKLERDLENWEQAWIHVTNVRDYFEQRVAATPRDEFLARSIWGHLAIIAVHLGLPTEAKEYCLRSLSFYGSYGTKAFLATLKYRLALAEIALAEYTNANQHLEEAMEWFDRLEMKPDYIEAAQTQQELQSLTQQQ